MGFDDETPGPEFVQALKIDHLRPKRDDWLAGCEGLSSESARLWGGPGLTLVLILFSADERLNF